MKCKQKSYNYGQRDTTKNLVGQPIFKQIINIIPKEKFEELALKCGSDKYYKTFFSWEQMVVMLFGIFSRCDSINGIKTQIWCTLIACLLLIVIQTLSKSKKAFSTIAALLMIHLISHLDLIWVVTETRRAYKKRPKSRNKSPTAVQMSFF